MAVDCARVNRAVFAVALVDIQQILERDQKLLRVQSDIRAREGGELDLGLPRVDKHDFH